MYGSSIGVHAGKAAPKHVQAGLSAARSPRAQVRQHVRVEACEKRSRFNMRIKQQAHMLVMAFVQHYSTVQSTCVKIMLWFGLTSCKPRLNGKLFIVCMLVRHSIAAGVYSRLLSHTCETVGGPAMQHILGIF